MMLDRDERQRFEEIVRDLDVDPPPPSGAADRPLVGPSLMVLALLVVGATGVVTGLAVADPVIVAVVGVVPILGAGLVVVAVTGLLPAGRWRTGPLAAWVWA
ncbi:MAG: hypothetical protein ACRDQ0_00420, partial [Pseudonocardia sp.]